MLSLFLQLQKYIKLRGQGVKTKAAMFNLAAFSIMICY